MKHGSYLAPGVMGISVFLRTVALWMLLRIGQIFVLKENTYSKYIFVLKYFKFLCFKMNAFIMLRNEIK